MIKEGIRLVVRPYEVDEWPVLSHWFYSGDYSEFFRDVSTAMNIEQFQTYANMTNGYAFTVRLKQTDGPHNAGTIVGFVVVYELRWVASTAKIGVLIDKNFQGHMYAMEAMWVLCDYLVNHLRLRKIIVETLKSNKRLEKITTFGGFKKEAILRKEAVMNGKEFDVVRYCLFAKDAKKRINEFKEVLCQHQ